MPAAVLAHAAHGNALGTPEWVLEAGLVVVALLTWLALRTSWPGPRLAGAADGRLLPGWTATLLRWLGVAGAAVGIGLWAVVLAGALFATDDPTENLATMVISLPIVAGGLLAAALLGEWWRAASPFVTLGRLLPEREDADAPWWAGPALLATLLWVLVPFHDAGQVRTVGVWLLAYTLVVLVGTATWGRAWVAAGEGIAIVLGAAGRMAPFSRDAASGRLRVRAPLTGLGPGRLPPGTTEALLLMAATVVYSAIHRLDWFQVEVMGVRSGWERTLVDTLGVAFAVGVGVAIWRGLAGPRADDAAPLVPLTMGVAVAFLLTDLLGRTIDVLALLSDPYGQDWNLFGTADWYSDVQWQASTRLAWAELAALAIGAVLAVIVAHDRGLAAEPDRAAAARGTTRVVAGVTVLATVALVVLLR